MPGLIGTVARTALVAGTATAVSNRVSRRQAGRWAAENQAHQPPPYLPPPPGRYQRPMYQPPPSYQPPPVNEQPAPPSPAPSPAPAAGPAADDMTVKLAQLQRLGELKAQGILTDEEFQAEKSKILGS
ncbi:MAG: SHOCT domain-containing protein [Chloroflexi bacterium]|nr:SHOCT domain-containing protein [Chloroflexota bacterium]